MVRDTIRNKRVESDRIGASKKRNVRNHYMKFIKRIAGNLRTWGTQVGFQTVAHLYRPVYKGCFGGNVPEFGIMFLKLKYTDITQNTYIRS